MMDLDSPASYAESCRRLAAERLRGLAGPAEAAAAEAELNAYPRPERLEPPRTVRFLEDLAGLEDLGRRAVLEGRVIWEHAAAGEATRLGLGRKFFLKPADLTAGPAAGSCFAADAGPAADSAALNSVSNSVFDAEPPWPVPLGQRHLLQPILEIAALAREAGHDPANILARQRFLVVASEETFEATAALTAAALAPFLPLENVWLMKQLAFHGLDRGPDGWFFDLGSPRRLHNHGQLAMQKTMDGQIRRLSDGGPAAPMSRTEFFAQLEEADDLASFNIEDLDYLTGALDLRTLGLAVRLGAEGCGMVMELSANHPQRPVKGGSCFWDPELGRDVMIEGFRLRTFPAEKFKLLNKNFNHYPRPARVFERLRQEGLFMPVAVKDFKVYFQPVQGDLNFLIPTAFFARREQKPLNSLKTSADFSAALAALKAQDRQPGFRELLSRLRRP
jgi:hypothetical protein